MKKFLTITLAILFMTVKTESVDEDFQDVEDEQFNEEYNDSISDIDSTEFVNALQTQLSNITSDNLSHQECVTLLLMIYSESSREEIEGLEQKLKNENDQLDEDEENILYFKGHLDEYFMKNHEKNEISKQELTDIVKNNTILAFLEQKMEEEEQLMENQVDEEDEVGDDDLNEVDFEHEEVEANQ